MCILIHQAETRLGLHEFDQRSDAGEQMLLYITHTTVNSTAEFDLFALFNNVPSRDEVFVFASAVVGSQGNRSPLSMYENEFVKCDVAASLPYVIMVSKNER